MKRKRLHRLLALFLAGLLLTGCTANRPPQRHWEPLALPSVRPGLSAPVGDLQQDREITAVLYVPTADGMRLTANDKTITVRSGQPTEEACVEAVLEEINEADRLRKQSGLPALNSSSQPLQLAITSSPVETTGNLVTVNLRHTTRSLSDEALFALEVAITNTLTALPGINYVNVLVNGQSIGLAYGALPVGVLANYPSGDISTYWGQISAQAEAQAEALEGAASFEMQKAVPLYFVSTDGQSLLGEVRNVTFSTQDIAAYAQTLLDELYKGPLVTEGSQRLMPDMGFLDRDPIFDASGRVVQLYFLPDVDNYLSIRGMTRAMLLSSICYTLTAFIPSLAGVNVWIGEELVSAMVLMNGEEWTDRNGLMNREDFTSLAADTCIVYFPLPDGSGLKAIRRPIVQRRRTQPRALLRELMRPESNPSVSAAIPAGIVDADIMGLYIAGDTALINLSSVFVEACQSLTQTEARNMVYAIVNTLTEIEGVHRVRFYENGGEMKTLAGVLMMSGEFLRHPGLIRE